jgi:cytochrome c oxidase cbb3-type subunit III
MWHRCGVIAHLCILLALGTPGALVAQDRASANPMGESQGSALFASNCAVCHGADGRGGEHAPDIATAADVQRLADKNLIDIVKNGITGTGMPGFGDLGQDKTLALISYLRTLQGKNIAVALPGNPEHGEALFFGKAQCSECHMARGKGGFIAADLSYSAGNTDASHLRQVILDPEITLPAQKKAVSVTTSTGQKFTGVLRAEDNFSITIQTVDGAFHYFPKSQLTSVDVGSRSLMPDNYRSRLSDTEVNDLVSYLLRIGTQSARANDASSDDDDE